MADAAATRIGVLVIGDEILSGKRQDRHFAHVVATLASRGLAPAWARYEGDDRDALKRTLRGTFASGDIVFSFGGVGATPDDHTRQARPQRSASRSSAIRTPSPSSKRGSGTKPIRIA